MVTSGLVNMFTSDVTIMFTSDSTKIFTKDLPSIFTSELAKIFTSGKANMFTSESKNCRDKSSLVKLTGEVVDLVSVIQPLTYHTLFEPTWRYQDDSHVKQ